MRGEFDVTKTLKPGGKNALAVRIRKNATPGSVKEKTWESPELRYESGRFKELARQPRFSLLTVLRDASPQHLNELIVSARCQSYEDWELLLVDDGSNSRKHLEVAKRWMDRDKRIHLKTLRAPLGPSRARNLAIEESTGDY